VDGLTTARGNCRRAEPRACRLVHARDSAGVYAVRGCVGLRCLRLDPASPCQLLHAPRPGIAGQDRSLGDVVAWRVPGSVRSSSWPFAEERARVHMPRAVPRSGPGNCFDGRASSTRPRVGLDIHIRARPVTQGSPTQAVLTAELQKQMPGQLLREYEIEKEKKALVCQVKHRVCIRAVPGLGWNSTLASRSVAGRDAPMRSSSPISRHVRRCLSN
jgi:hypothetical protein